MAKKTKAEINEEMNAAVAEKDAAIMQYNELLAQAQQIQAQSAHRLILLRLFESFANEVSASLQKLQRDIMEITTQQAQEQEESGETGEEI